MLILLTVASGTCSLLHVHSSHLISQNPMLPTALSSYYGCRIRGSGKTCWCPPARKYSRQQSSGSSENCCWNFYPLSLAGSHPCCRVVPRAPWAVMAAFGCRTPRGHGRDCCHKGGRLLSSRTVPHNEEWSPLPCQGCPGEDLRKNVLALASLGNWVFILITAICD